MSAQQPTIRPAKQPIATFDETWPVLEGLLNQTIRQQLLEGRTPNLLEGASYTEYMTTYTKCWNFSSNKLRSEREKLYPALSQYFFQLADDMLSTLSPSNKDPHIFLHAYLDAYDCFLGAALVLPRLLRMYDDNFLLPSGKEWLQPLKLDRDTRHWQPACPPGHKLVNPNPRKITVRDGMRHQEAVSMDTFVPVPIERVAVEEEILRFDSGSVSGASLATAEGGEVAELLWPTEGRSVRSGHAGVDAKEKEQFEARKYTAFPVDAIIPLIPLVLRLWRVASVKRFGPNGSLPMAEVVRGLRDELQEEREERKEGLKRLAVCFWAAGVREEELGFGELVELMKANAEVV